MSSLASRTIMEKSNQPLSWKLLKGRTYEAECLKATAVFVTVASANDVGIVASETGLCIYLSRLAVQTVSTVAWEK